MEKFEKMDLSLSEILGIDNEYELLNRQAKVMWLSIFNQPNKYSLQSKTNAKLASLISIYSKCSWIKWLMALNDWVLGGC